MKTVNLTMVNVFMLLVLCIITSGSVQMAGAASVGDGGSWVDGFIDPNLPPVHPNPNVAYHSGEGYVYYLGMGITVFDITHGNFTNINREYIGGDEIETFDSVLTAVADVPGVGQFPTTLTGPVTTKVYNKAGQTLGTWNTEILYMTLTGNIPLGYIMIRESPTLSSVGITSVDLGSDFRIDSFFDVFTELSIDGGQTWMPAVGSCRMTLIPEPATICLLGLGALSLIRRKSNK